MSIVVGIVHNDGVTIGSDSIVVTDDNTCTIATEETNKLFFKNDLLFGGVGDFIILQHARHTWTCPKNKSDLDPLEYLIKTVCPSLKRHLATVISKSDEGKSNTTSEAEFMVAYQGRLFEILEDYMVLENPYGYGAIGAGERVALGALDCLVRSKLSPETSAQRAMEVAYKYCQNVRPPYIVHTLRNE